MRGKVDIPELIPLLEKAGIEKVVYIRDPILATTCMLEKNNKIIAVGHTFLHPYDQFCRRTGRIVSLRRAIKNLDLKGRRNGTN